MPIHIEALISFSRLYRVFHPPISISGSREFREILLVQKLSLLHILSTHCTRLVQSLHPIAKDAFQGDVFNIPENVPDPLKK
jgi:hypothetical protein